MPRLQRWALALILVIAVVGVASGSVAGATAADADQIVFNTDDSDTDDTDTDDSDTDDSDTDDSDTDDSDTDDSDTDDSDTDDSDTDDSDTDDSDTDDSDTGDSDDSDDTGTSEPEPAPAEFMITNVETNTPTTVGETVEVTVGLENTGDESATKEVRFSLDEYLKDEMDVQMNAGETKSVTLTYVTKSGDAKDWALTVETPDDDDTRTVTVEEPSRDSGSSGSSGSSSSSSGGSTYTVGQPEFRIDEFEVDGPIKAGETLRMNATVTNTGTAGGERLVWFTVEDHTINETVVDLDMNAETTLSYAHNTTANRSGEWNLSAQTPDDRVDRSVEVMPLRSNLTIDDVETNGPVTADEWLNVTVTVNNTGDISDEQAVTLFLDDQRMDTRNVTVAANESSTVTLTYRTNEWVTGELNLSVAMGDDRETFVATVDEKTPEPTETETETGSTTTETTEDATTEAPAEQAAGPTDDSVPGFGAVVALVALLATIGLLKGRKR
ncbi:CARDB domain-containing protein [Halorubrum sp. DTA98]|uniref:CARDB domain-containing protein n=1 Tax=Halorubrum sp. DTA98 TaxID=3402163 RepID=UPI003AAE9AD7